MHIQILMIASAIEFPRGVGTKCALEAAENSS